MGVYTDTAPITITVPKSIHKEIDKFRYSDTSFNISYVCTRALEEEIEHIYLKANHTAKLKINKIIDTASNKERVRTLKFALEFCDVLATRKKTISDEDITLITSLIRTLTT